MLNLYYTVGRTMEFDKLYVELSVSLLDIARNSCYNIGTKRRERSHMSMYYILENDDLRMCNDYYDGWEELDSPIVGMFYTNGREEPTNIPLTQEQIARLNELAQDETTEYVFWRIWQEIDGSPIESLYKALKVKFKLYLDEEGEKDALTKQWWEECFGKIPEGAERYINLDDFFYDELENRENFYGMEDFVVEIEKEG